MFDRSKIEKNITWEYKGIYILYFVLKNSTNVSEAVFWSMVGGGETWNTAKQTAVMTPKLEQSYLSKTCRQSWTSPFVHLLSRSTLFGILSARF